MEYLTQSSEMMSGRAGMLTQAVLLGDSSRASSPRSLKSLVTHLNHLITSPAQDLTTLHPGIHRAPYRVFLCLDNVMS